ncbi:putative Mitochondrial dicarboxylate carrier [Taphrina deformans PYCC 5710]|uniref:Mitochondrial dicarboxylate carrier n=1 Tax=Taphrina deformans (strain PYCC 5710 / ATCC 11124 / CBS 356.35 / IMI 108563 / JCM 9778 / NBRC 8474) TaxID=1097556 RepID=R4X904_TAPDE|nr:putative Mitochondrial dicarboxylate carrier [Taphrina deformans PYCC 5710]|eukprot:CCG80632.1 putative Mitochondrial dicarboxylate carrier [Taphrina deformans PYCC 5710]
MVAATCTHPLDLAKVRMQMSNDTKSGFVRTIIRVYQNEGFRSLYAGLTASLLRQATYSTTRFGVYEELKGWAQGPEGQPPGPGTLVALACFSGFVGAAVGNPADVLNVRMQNDQTLAPEKRRNYKHALDGLVRMTREEGVKSLFRGLTANCARGVLMTASQLASYDTFKHALLNTGFYQEGLVTHFTASLMAGFVATTVCSPFDVIKTRIMNTQKNRSFIEVLRYAVQHEGWGFAFRGFAPSFIRLGPHTIVTFMVLEQQKKIYQAVTTP